MGGPMWSSETPRSTGAAHAREWANEPRVALRMCGHCEGRPARRGATFDVDERPAASAPKQRARILCVTLAIVCRLSLGYVPVGAPAYETRPCLPRGACRALYLLLRKPHNQSGIPFASRCEDLAL